MGCGGSKAADKKPPPEEKKAADKPPAKTGAAPSRQLLEDYTLGKVLGQGAFGIVYLCKKKGSTKEFAVKMIDKVESPLEDIKREARMLEKLTHPNVVKLHDVYYEKVFVCMVMDIYKGGDLIEGMQAHWRTKGMIPCDKNINIGHQMVASIGWLHQNLVVHRDVKGDNYLMDRNDVVDPNTRIFLSDFGTVIETKEAERLTSKAGTKVYWSPEFYNLDYSLKVDIWAIGIVMYGLVVGNFPFKGEADARNKRVKLPPRCPKECADFILKLLDKEEDKRLSAVSALAHPWLKSKATAAKDAEAPQQLDFTPEMGEKKAVAGVNERRQELVQRLENANASKPGAGMSARRSDIVAPNEKDKFKNASFSVEFKKINRSVKYEWWPEKKVNDAKLLADDNAPPAKDEGVAASVEVMKKLLEEHGIKTSDFGKGQAKSLQDLTEEVQSGACRMMLDASKHKVLMRVVNVVLLRLYVGSGAAKKYCVQTKEVMADGRTRSDKPELPGSKKEAYENDMQTAQRVIKERLKMEDGKIEFDMNSKESYEEEEDSTSYPGVRTVYNKVIVECQVTTQDKAVMSRIGANDGKEMTVKDDKGIARSYMWFAEKACTDKGVKLKTPKELGEISALVSPPVGFDEDTLIEFLEASKVDITKFGTGGARTLKDFSNELSSGEATLDKQADGSIIRIVDIVVLKMYKKGTNDLLIEVAETVTPEGKAAETKQLNRMPASKRRPDENHFTAAQRVFEQILCINENTIEISHSDVKIVEEFKDSNNYPGIKSKYRKRVIRCDFVGSVD